MKIYVDRVPDEGIEIKETLNPHSESLDLGRHGVLFTDEIIATAKVVKAGAELIVDIVVDAPVEYICSRCLSRFGSLLRKSFRAIHKVRPGDVVELDEEIRQELILEYPMKSLCSDDCKGLCPNCGQNLNQGRCDCGTSER